MRKPRPGRAALVIGAALLLGWAAPARSQSVERGKYIFAAGGCNACHTDTQAKTPPLSGGAPLATPFGTFYPPNITPDPVHGIGSWSFDQFDNALQRGVGPHGEQLYPVFPYTTYTHASRQDVEDLWAYLKTVPPSDRPSHPQEARFPISIRLTVLPWKWLNFSPGPWQPDSAHDAVWNRGSYLVESLLHCAECHTPRNASGGVDRSRWMAGAHFGPDNNLAPDLTPSKDGLADWSDGDIETALKLGMTPDGDFLGNEMAEVVADGTSQLTDADRHAVAVYLKALPPLPAAAK